MMVSAPERLMRLLLRAVVDLIDIEHEPEVGHTNYQFVAGKQRLSMLRKDIYGTYLPPSLYEIVKKNVDYWPVYRRITKMVFRR